MTETEWEQPSFESNEVIGMWSDRYRGRPDKIIQMKRNLRRFEHE